MASSGDSPSLGNARKLLAPDLQHAPSTNTHVTTHNFPVQIARAVAVTLAGCAARSLPVDIFLAVEMAA